MPSLLAMLLLTLLWAIGFSRSVAANPELVNVPKLGENIVALICRRENYCPGICFLSLELCEIYGESKTPYLD